MGKRASHVGDDEAWGAFTSVPMWRWDWNDVGCGHWVCGSDDVGDERGGEVAALEEADGYGWCAWGEARDHERGGVAGGIVGGVVGGVASGDALVGRRWRRMLVRGWGVLVGGDACVWCGGGGWSWFWLRNVDGEAYLGIWERSGFGCDLLGHAASNEDGRVAWNVQA